MNAACAHDDIVSRDNRAVKEYHIRMYAAYPITEDMWKWRCATCYVTIRFTDEEVERFMKGDMG